VELVLFWILLLTVILGIYLVYAKRYDVPSKVSTLD
jgi:hypothetical protein